MKLHPLVHYPPPDTNTGGQESAVAGASATGGNIGGTDGLNDTRGGEGSDNRREDHALSPSPAAVRSVLDAASNAAMSSADAIEAACDEAVDAENEKRGERGEDMGEEGGGGGGGGVSKRRSKEKKDKRKEKKKAAEA